MIRIPCVTAGLILLAASAGAKPALSEAQTIARDVRVALGLPHRAPAPTVDMVGERLSACLSRLHRSSPRHADVTFSIDIGPKGVPVAGARLLAPAGDAVEMPHLRKLLRAEAAIATCTPLAIDGWPLADQRLTLAATRHALFVTEMERLGSDRGDLPTELTDTAARPDVTTGAMFPGLPAPKEDRIDSQPNRHSAARPAVAPAAISASGATVTAAAPARGIDPITPTAYVGATDRGAAPNAPRIGAHRLAGRADPVRRPAPPVLILGDSSAADRAVAERQVWPVGRIHPDLAAPQAARPQDERGLSLDRLAQQFVQRALLEAGYDPGPLDGILGPRSRAALSAWQRAQGYPPTGHLDAAQFARLTEPQDTPVPDLFAMPDTSDRTETLAAVPR